MPVPPAYPGVYVSEVAGGVRTIAGVPTSVTAIIGRLQRGVVDQPVLVFNAGDAARRFGGLWSEGPAAYAVDDFFANGGGQAVIVRLFRPLADDDDGVARLTAGNLPLVAADPGAWGNGLTVLVTHPDAAAAEAAASRYGLAATALFDLTVDDALSGQREFFRHVSVDPDAGARRIDRVLAAQSALVRVARDGLHAPMLPDARPAENATGTGAGGNDGAALDPADMIGDENGRRGLHALLKTDIFNLLVIPPDQRGGTVDPAVWEKAAEFCARRRAFLIVDPPGEWDFQPDEAVQTVLRAQQATPILSPAHAANAALFFPRYRRRDPLRDGEPGVFTPAGMIAGLMARTDAMRGVWKAPAGTEAGLSGLAGLTVNLTNAENRLLNPIAVNCLRRFPDFGHVVWGARTLSGSDQDAGSYKYIPVRRLALFIEESLCRGTQWVVFEPIDEKLMAQVRLNVEAFMHGLFRQGALQGASAREAYFVRCDETTTTQDDINRGIVNIRVGFAPLRPAEFVTINIQQARDAT